MDFPLSPRSQQGTRCPPATLYPTPQPPRRGGATAGVSPKHVGEAGTWALPARALSCYTDFANRGTR